MMPRTLIALVLLCLGTSAEAQITDSRLPISLDADFSDYDGKNSMLLFRGLRLSQGPISIEADEGRASKLDFEESVWQLAGNVVIVVNDGRIECDLANLEFVDNQLRIADISGSPAKFDMRRPGLEERTYAEAEKLRYDLVVNAIEFSGNAKIVEGGNQISSGFLVYNIGEQRIQAEGSDSDDGRVKITFTPRDQGPSTPADGAGDGEAPNESGQEPPPE